MKVADLFQDPIPSVVPILTNLTLSTLVSLEVASHLRQLAGVVTIPPKKGAKVEIFGL